QHTQLEGAPAVWCDDTPVPLADLGSVLGGTPQPSGPTLVLTSLAGRHAFRVGEVLAQRDVVIKSLPETLPRLDTFAGASIEPDGSILTVLDPLGLVERARQSQPAVAAPTLALAPVADE